MHLKHLFKNVTNGIMLPFIVTFFSPKEPIFSGMVGLNGTLQHLLGAMYVKIVAHYM